MKAEFIIVGVMKSGTTTLAHHLTNHPDIAIPKDEVHFFDYDNIFAKGVEWYEKLFDDCNKGAKAIAGEKTPYSFYPYTAERIFNYNPNMKLIWIFRNPVDRAFSNYVHDLYNIDEWRSFEKCIQQEDKRSLLAQYLSKGRYVDQVKRFLRYFPIEQMHFVLFDDLIKNPAETLKPLFEFLGVEAQRFVLKNELHSKISQYPKHNPAILYFYKKITSKGRLWNYLWRINFSNPVKRRMKSETRKWLVDYFKPYNEELQRITGINTSTWNN